MPRPPISILLASLLAVGCGEAPQGKPPTTSSSQEKAPESSKPEVEAGKAGEASPPKVAEIAETRYLIFQLMTVLGSTTPAPFGENPPVAPTKEQMTGFVREIAKAIGTTGDARHKLGFAPTHFPFDMTDDDARRVIRESFAVARENDVAVAFHLDDSMYWGGRADLLSNPDNIETADWKQIPNTGRRVDWGPSPPGSRRRCATTARPSGPPSRSGPRSSGRR